jgi:hypothetical protein
VRSERGGEQLPCAFDVAHCAGACGAHPRPHTVPDNRRHSKIEGQVRGVSRMVTDGRYCVDSALVWQLPSGVQQFDMGLSIASVWYPWGVFEGHGPRLVAAWR